MKTPASFWRTHGERLQPAIPGFNRLFRWKTARSLGGNFCPNDAGGVWCQPLLIEDSILIATCLSAIGLCVGGKQVIDCVKKPNLLTLQQQAAIAVLLDRTR